MSVKELQIPLTDDDVTQLRVGDTVYLTGRIHTARDMAHLAISDALAAGNDLPVDLDGGVIFHAGPVARQRDDGGWDLIVIGPTTSIRMEPYAEMVGELGVKAIIGKGGMAEETIAAARKYSYVYLQAAPGCAVQQAAGIKAISGVDWLDLGMPEAVWSLEAERFGPLVVAMDAHGASIYDDVRTRAQEAAALIVARY